LLGAALILPLASASAQSPAGGEADLAAHARELRENLLQKVEPLTSANVAGYDAVAALPSTSGWKENIITTIFWVDKKPSGNNAVPGSSSWDSNRFADYGGYDNPDPAARRNFRPVAFVPRLNPFYCALPYNDLTREGTKPEAKLMIPWFKQAFVQEGHSVCKDHWVAIRHGSRVAYAQWEDCGPFRTDHFQYVFGNDRPLPNLNGGAGLEVSPAVRDYLEMNATKDVCSWRFVDSSEVPAGPWQSDAVPHP
jgi:hypothetical protein